jgi:ribonuclease P protein component
MNNSYAKKNFSTKQPTAGEKTRVSRADGDQKRARRIETPPGKRTQAINGSALLDFRLPKANRLRKRREFLNVYSKGKRFNGRLITVFLVPSPISTHKLGITASKKAIGSAVERNRVKRLLREAFRLSCTELNNLEGKYEWVLNARRGLLEVKLEETLRDFRQIIETVKNSESEINRGENNIAVETQKDS